ncbi:MAG: acyloxyacyl hydrolase [Flavisolibacter sp.]
MVTISLTLALYEGYAQPTKNIFINTTLSLKGHYGSFLTSSPKALYLKDSYSHFFELGFSRPLVKLLNGSPEESAYWGLSLFSGNTGSRRYMGRMKGIFPFIGFTLLHVKNFESALQTGFGVGFVDKPYNLKTNHKNVLIGSRGNAFIQFLWRNQLRVSERIGLEGGLSFSHLSNGNTKLPNLGLNIPAFYVGLSYRRAHQTNNQISGFGKGEKKMGLAFTGSLGLKQAPWIRSKRYGTTIIEAELQRQKRLGIRFGAGVAFFYDPSKHHMYLDSIVTLGKTSMPVLNSGPFISYEKILGKFSIPIQFGFSLFASDTGPFFQNLGFRYRLNHHFFLNAGLFTHWGKADFMHLGLHYQL